MLQFVLKCQITSLNGLGGSKTTRPNELKFHRSLFETIRNQFMVKYFQVTTEQSSNTGYFNII